MAEWYTCTSMYFILPCFRVFHSLLLYTELTQQYQSMKHTHTRLQWAWMTRTATCNWNEIHAQQTAVRVLHSSTGRMKYMHSAMQFTHSVLVCSNGELNTRTHSRMKHTQNETPSQQSTVRVFHWVMLLCNFRVLEVHSVCAGSFYVCCIMCVMHYVCHGALGALCVSSPPSCFQVGMPSKHRLVSVCCFFPLVLRDKCTSRCQCNNASGFDVGTGQMQHYTWMSHVSHI